jgi:hypothetical protein
MEQRWNFDTGKLEEWKRNLTWCYFAHRKCHLDYKWEEQDALCPARETFSSSILHSAHKITRQQVPSLSLTFIWELYKRKLPNHCSSHFDLAASTTTLGYIRVSRGRFRIARSLILLCGCFGLLRVVFPHFSVCWFYLMTSCSVHFNFCTPFGHV